MRLKTTLLLFNCSIFEDGISKFKEIVGSFLDKLKDAVLPSSDIVTKERPSHKAFLK